jgi:hypothetical protein
MYPPLVEVIKARNPEMARTLVRRALESFDAAWARRHPPPGVMPAANPLPLEKVAPAAEAEPAARTKKEKKR